MTPAIVLLLAAVATWLLRVSFIAILPAGHLPPRLHGVLDDVAPAVMAAVVASQLVHGDGPAGLASPELLAALVTAAVAWRTQKLGLTVVVGVAAAGLAQLLTGGA